MRMWERQRITAARYQSGKMRHVHHQVSADLVADFAEAAKIDNPRIRGATSDNDLRPMLASEFCHFYEVDAGVGATYAIWHRVEPFARQIDGRTVGKVATCSKIEPHECVAGLHQREEKCGGRRRA